MQHDCTKVSDAEKLSALRLIRSENLGTKTFFSLLELFGSASNALEKVKELGFKRNSYKSIKLIPEQQALEEFEKTYDFGAEILYFTDDLYPKILK